MLDIGKDKENLFKFRQNKRTATKKKMKSVKPNRHSMLSDAIQLFTPLTD